MAWPIWKFLNCDPEIGGRTSQGMAALSSGYTRKQTANSIQEVPHDSDLAEGSSKRLFFPGTWAE